MITLRKISIAALFVVLVLALNAFPQLVLRRAYTNGDPLVGFYPVFHVYQQYIRAGQSVLWQGGLLGGFPEYLDLTGGFYSPVNRVLFHYVPVIDAYNLAIVFGITLLALCTYALARDFGLMPMGATLTTIAYTLGYHNSNWSNNLVVVNALFTLPLLLLVVRRSSSREWWWPLIGIAGIAYALMNGQPQWVLMAFVGAAIYAIVAHSDWQRWKHGARMLFLLVGVGIVSAFCSWWILAPAQSLAMFSARANGLSFSAAEISAQTPLDWLWYVLPELNIKWLSATEPTLYIGFIPLLLAAIAWKTRWRDDQRVRIGVALFLFGIITALRYSPVFWVLHQLPIFSLFRGANRWMYVGNLGLTLLAGIGLDELVASRIPQPTIIMVRRLLGKIMLYLGVVIGLGSVVYGVFGRNIVAWLQAIFDARYYAHTTGLPLEHYHEVIKTLVKNLFSNIGIWNPVVITAAGAIAASYLVFRWLEHDRPSARVASVLLTVTALNLLLLHPNWRQTVRADVVTTPPGTIQLIQKSEGVQLVPVRMFAFQTGAAIDQLLRTPHADVFTPEDVIVLSQDLGVPNSPLSYGVQTIDGYNNLMPRRIARVLAELSSERATATGGLATEQIPLASKSELFVSRLPLLSMANVKYVTSAYRLPISKDLQLIASVSSTRFDIPVYLYENKAVLSRVYLASSVRFVTDNEETAFTILTDPANNFSVTTLIGCPACTQTGSASLRDAVTVKAYRDGLLTAHVSTKYGRWLIFSESNLPGWQVTLGGVPVSVETANYLFQAVFIPAGEHDVQWEYVGIGH